ncbi:hypothetical protein FOL47_001635 [Perkinsus chesapeaki]|uniref:RAP domain-containing protein n=1 Tax=Perkinsus chesapeaki TaxID=330153 RepID=A0A7J6N0M4_PERCH|nr:hypothetical protein FOL47_001635 [Perkinsus chesapeaki]
MYVTRQLRSALSTKDAGRQVKELRKLLDSRDRGTSTAACKRVADILTNASDSPIRLEFTLLAAALGKCSQMPSGPQQQHRMLTAISEAMIQRLEEDKSHGLSPKRLAETLRVIAVIGRSAPEAVVKLRGMLRPQLLPAIPDMAALQLRHVAWAINRLSLPWRDEVRLAVSTLLDRIGVSSVGSEELATFVWAASRMGCCTPQLAATVALDWTGRINSPGVTPEAHAMVLSSLGATAKTRDDVLLLFDTCSAQLDLSSLNTSSLASLLWAFGHVTNAPLNARVWKTCLATFTEATVRDCPLSSLGNACWAAGTIFQCTSSDLPLVFIRHICGLIASSDLGPFPSSAISSIVWAASLANDGGPWVEGVFRHLLGNGTFPLEKVHLSSQWKPLELATVLASIADASLDQALSGFIDLARASVVETVNSWPSTSQNALAVSQLSRALWSSGEVAILPMVEWALANGHVLTPQSESRILWAAAKMFEASALREQPACVVAFIERLYQRCCERQAQEYSQQDVGLMAWSLGTLRLAHYDLEDKCCLFGINMLFNNIIDSRHLSMLLWGITSNSHTSPKALQLIKHAVHRIEDGTFRPLPADVSLIIWSLAVADHYSDRALRQLLWALFTDGAVISPAAPHTERGASLIRLHRALLWARVCHGFVPNNEEEAKLMAIAKAQRVPGGGILNSSTLQLEIRTQLQNIISTETPTASLRDEYELPCPLEGIFVDLAVIAPDGRVELVVEVDGYSHFSQVIGSGTLPSLQYNGATELSRRILRKAGYRVLSINTVDWNNTQRHERGQFLTRLFREAMS